MESNSENNIQKNTEEVNESSPDTLASTSRLTNIPSNDSFEDKPKKKSHAMVITLILLAILAVGGTGFGIWAWTNGDAQNKKNEDEIITLRTELKNTQEALDKIAAEKEENIEIKKEEEKKEDENIKEADYIYIGDWGIKIKKPEDLSIIEYSFTKGDTYGDILRVSGAKEKSNGAIPAYAHLDASVGGIVRADSDDGFYPYGELVYTDKSGKKYYYESPNGIPNIPESDMGLWGEVRTIFKNTLTNPGNFSEI
ncbi:hypothetical protein IKE72_00525 [Candidatus Saccharibacteria bacterium]|nr:hypothetical protein [Candidatus Saccharibacteria bacterium]